MANNTKIKIAILSSFTLNGLEDMLKRACETNGISVEVYQAGYNQIPQEILNPASGLRRFQPDITFLFTNAEKALGEIIINPFGFKAPAGRSAYVSGRISEFINITGEFIRQCPGLLVVGNLPHPAYSPFGIQEGKVEMSVGDMIGAFNTALKQQALSEKRLYVADMAAFFARHGARAIIHDPFYYIGDLYIQPAFMEALARECLAFVKPLAGKSKKCIVLDLDGTLWGGIVGEDGIEGIKLDTKPPGNAYYDFQRYLKALNDRGILLAINSKNNPEDALKAIREHPHMVLREDSFASIQINWRDKAENIRAIADDLNIGTDSFVFIDDDPLQRERIRSEFPEIFVVDVPRDPALYVRTLQDIVDFNILQLTDDDFRRAQSYIHQRKVNELKSSVSSMEDFLRGLGMEVTIMPADDFTVPRIAQLTNKTNQFNLTTRRYTEADIDAMRKNVAYQVYSFSAKDVFGDHGIIGVVIVKERGGEWLIDTFLMSCRVIGRDIEKAVLSSLAGYAKKRGAQALVGEYIPTVKNSLCKDAYARAGFAETEEGRYRLDQYDSCTMPDYIKITEPKTWNV